VAVKGNADACALGGQRFRDGAADASRAAGNHGHAAGKAELTRRTRRPGFFGQGSASYITLFRDPEHDAEQGAPARDAVDERDRTRRIDGDPREPE